MRTSGVRKSLFHSPQSLIVGDAPLVGVLDLPGTCQRPPIRLFFPATTTTTTARTSALTQASYFVDNRAAYVLQGFAHIVLARHTTKLFRWFLRPLVWILSYFFPARFLKIPGTVQVKKKDADASSVKYSPPSSLALKNPLLDQPQRTQSLVVFSHGLTGTGEENSIFCTSLAKRGHVVASIHHRDGSSCRVPLPDGTCRYYEHLPTGDDYDPRHRLEQVHARAKEFLYTCSWLMGEEESDGVNHDEDRQHPIVDQIRLHANGQKIIASGFSYGATTASLAATLAPDKFRCAIFLDGWFHVDYSSKGVEMDFPPEAFGAGWPQQMTPPTTDTKVADTDFKTNVGLAIPSLFINSSQFQSYTKLHGATCRLADRINHNSSGKEGEETEKQRTEMHVIPDTRHQDFCDVAFWLPRQLSQKMFNLGGADPCETYEAILDWTVKFLERF